MEKIRLVSVAQPRIRRSRFYFYFFINHYKSAERRVHVDETYIRGRNQMEAVAGMNDKTLQYTETDEFLVHEIHPTITTRMNLYA